MRGPPGHRRLFLRGMRRNSSILVWTSALVDTAVTNLLCFCVCGLCLQGAMSPVRSALAGSPSLRTPASAHSMTMLDGERLEALKAAVAEKRAEDLSVELEVWLLSEGPCY